MPRADLYHGISQPSTGARGVCGASQRPGRIVVDLDGTMIGMVILDRRDAKRPVHVRSDVGEAEVGFYMFLSQT